MTRLWASVAATAIAVTAIGLAAPGAGAVHTRNVYVCNSAGTAGLGAQSISANPGDTIRVFNNCNNTGGTGVFRYPATDPSVWQVPNLNWPVLSSVSAVVNKVGSSSQKFGQVGVGTNLMTLTVNAVSEPVPGPPPFEPHDYLQQVVLPESGSCDDIPPESGHWHGTPFGGWSQSWAQWPNGGVGGFVCTRMVETTEAGELIIVG
jgi:hypothetical protein